MREPIAFVEIEQDFCNLTYGVAPCMAGIGVTGNTQCYNTLRTCQDANNFSRGTKNLWFRDASTRGASTEIGAWLVEGEFTAVAGDTQIRPLDFVFPSNVAWSFVEVSQLFFGEKGKGNQVLPYELSGVYGYNSTDGNNSR